VDAVTATLRLRDYQRETIDALFAAWADGMRRPAVVLPTGAGKTVVFSHLIQEFTRSEYGGAYGPRVIVLVHRDELADQAISKIRSVAPHLSVGKVKAESSETQADVMVCSVQTISRPMRLREIKQIQQNAGNIGLIITDECHHGAARSYQTIYNAFPGALHAGFTATLERGDGVGLGSVWDDVVYSRSPLWMMKHGYLVQPRAFTEDVGSLDLKSVKTTGGDYQSGDLGRALEESEIGQALPRACKEHADGRPTVVFTPTVSSAHMVSEEFNAFGTPSAVISGETPREDRQRIFEDFRLGRTQVLVNCMVLTEGWDAPWASCAVIARPTKSRALYQQMVGRVLRPWKGKTDAVILNVAGGGGRISTLIDLEPGSVQEIGEGEGLLDAEEREELEEAETAAERKDIARQAKLRMTEVKGLFAASHQAWLSTAGGVQFIGAGEWTYFLWPSQAEPGTWDVLRRESSTGLWHKTVHVGLDVELAMSWAEAEAEDHGSFSISRKASWRRGTPTQRQLDRAARLGLDATGMNKSEISDLMYWYEVSWALDPYVGVV
jgi:superfamily II DNA or RNA helicase